MAIRKVCVAMSGGVDSSAAVWLLQQAGYDPVGFTMSLFSPDACPRPALPVPHRPGRG